MLKKYYLGRFFWATIPHKQYQNMSGFAGGSYPETRKGHLHYKTIFFCNKVALYM